jgi:hypothetical protein
MSKMLEPTRRQLSQVESRYVRAQIRNLSARAARAPRGFLAIGGGIVFAFWMITILLSDSPFIVVTLFWLAAGGAILLWTGWEVRKDAGHFKTMIRRLESALRRNAADVYDIRAKSFAEFEEIEDEGGCYAFELENGRMVFISGQQFYPSAKFTGLDFSLVYLLDENDRPADMLIEKRGAKAKPAKIIPSVTKRDLQISEHLEMHPGRIDNLETQLWAAT